MMCGNSCAVRFMHWKDETLNQSETYEVCYLILLKILSMLLFKIMKINCTAYFLSIVTMYVRVEQCLHRYYLCTAYIWGGGGGGGLCYRYWKKHFFFNVQLNFDILNTDISNTMDVSKWFASPNHLFSYELLDIT